MNNAVTRGFVIFGVLILVVAFVCIGPAFFWLPQAHIGVPLPVIALPGEALAANFLGVQGFNLTNTLTSLVVVDILVLLIGYVVWRATHNVAPDRFIPSGFTHLMELVTEFLYNQAKGMLGTFTIKVFPMAATIFLFLLVANLVKLVPGVESVGIISCAEQGQPGYGVQNPDRPAIFLDVNSGNLGGRAGTKATEADTQACVAKYPQFAPVVAATSGKPEATTAGEKTSADLFVVVPYFRALATDLNLPLALAIIVVIMVQVWGVQQLGPAYFFKFINIPALGNLQKKPLGAIDFIVGLVEIISEISRIISLSFRLFGNIFAGGVLLIVMTFLVAGVLPSIFYFLEIFVGLIQAYVFSVLTMIYASQAIVAHHEGDEHEHEHEGAAEHSAAHA